MPAILASPSTGGLQRTKDTVQALSSFILFVHQFAGRMLWTTLFLFPTSDLAPWSVPPQTGVSYLT